MKGAAMTGTEPEPQEPTAPEPAPAEPTQPGEDELQSPFGDEGAGADDSESEPSGAL
jgi:hypothetical protein